MSKKQYMVLINGYRFWADSLKYKPNMPLTDKEDRECVSTYLTEQEKNQLKRQLNDYEMHGKNLIFG